jgi:2-polyprenyl-3-methyl-5-hydroxy-6-metoxy-1,4-benzoquinol methylase
MPHSMPDHCRLCAADSKHLSLRAPHVFGGESSHAFWECDQCGIIFLSPVPSPQDEARFYRQEFEKFMDARSGPAQGWTKAEAHVASNQDNVARRMKVLAPYLRDGVDVLEIGCSSGFMLGAITAAGGRCCGVEPSAVFTEYLQAKGYPVYASLEELEAREPQRYDLIVHFFVLEHIADPDEFLNRQLRLLKPGGRVIMEVPSATDALTSLYRIPAFEMFYWSIAHHYYYRPNSLHFLLNRLGVRFQLSHCQRYDLSNHMTWMNEGKPGGQGRYAKAFSAELVEIYRRDLIAAGYADTVFVVLSQAD